jgi:hypothetical protein
MSEPCSREAKNIDANCFPRSFGDQKSSQWGGVIQNGCRLKSGQYTVT